MTFLFTHWRRRLARLIALLIMAASITSHTSAAKEWRNDNGDYLAYDGVFYSFVTADGKRGVKLWTPPGEDPVRGVILHGNPGGGLGGDTRSKTRQTNVLEFAVQHHFAVAGVAGFPGTEVYGELGKIIIKAFEEWGQGGDHPELAHLPFISTGGSNAGIFSFGMMCYRPDRAIAITPNAGPVYVGEVTDAARNVPAWMHIGTLDPIIVNGIVDTENLFAEHGPQKSLWAWEAEIKGHENGSSDHIDMAYWNALIPMRLPEEMTPGEPVALITPDPRDGWFVDQTSWDYPLVKAAPAGEIEDPYADPGRYGWMPNEGLARLYQAAATRARPITLTLAETSQSEGPATSGVFLSSGNTMIVNPGEEITVEVGLVPLAFGFEEIAIWDRATELGRINLAETKTFTFTAEKGRTLYALYARGIQQRRVRDGGGYDRTSAPLMVLVRDPEKSQAITEQMEQVSITKRMRETNENSPVPTGLAEPTPPEQPLPSDALGVVRLQDSVDDAAAAREVLKQSGRPVQVTSEHLAPGGKKPEGAPSEAMNVSAGYNPTGLYLLFDITDPSHSPDDAVDFHIATVTRKNLEGDPAPDLFARPAVNSLLRNALQYAVEFGSEGVQPQAVGFNYVDPWDVNRVELGGAPDPLGTGLVAEVYRDGTDAEAEGEAEGASRDILLYLPWSMVGNPGLPKIPEPGLRMTLLLGYNEADAGAKFRWPHRQDPWAANPQEVQAKNVWGELIFLPAE